MGEGLVVSAKVFESGFSSQFKSDIYIFEAQVVNSTSAPINIVMMDTDSDASWQVSPEGGFEVLGHTANHNYSVKRTFPPRCGFKFRLLVRSLKANGSAENAKIKLGFCAFKCPDGAGELTTKFYEERHSQPILWSQEIPLPKTKGVIFHDIIEQIRIPCKDPELFAETATELIRHAPEAKIARLPFAFATKKAIYVVESDGKHIEALACDGGWLIWAKDLSWEWSSDWNGPHHGIKAMSVASLKYDGGDYLSVILNDGSVGRINMETGLTQGLISD
jgi:hypothetical protein